MTERQPSAVIQEASSTEGMITAGRFPHNQR